MRKYSSQNKYKYESTRSIKNFILPRLFFFFLTTRDFNPDCWIFPTKRKSAFEFGWAFEFK